VENLASRLVPEKKIQRIDLSRKIKKDGSSRGIFLQNFRSEHIHTRKQASHGKAELSKQSSRLMIMESAFAR
jgi:hypothetical protein